MSQKRGKMIALKGVLAICLLVNNFSSFGAVVKANTIETENAINLDITEDLTNSDEFLPESNESQESLPSEGDNPTGGETPSDEEVDEPEEVLPDETPSDEEVDEPEEVLLHETPSDEETSQPQDTLLEQVLSEEELLSIESRSSGSGLVQLWQVVPDGQQSKEGTTTAQIMKALQCRPNHNLYPSGGQSEHNTYVNSCYVDDALYLGEEANYYKIYLSGYEGKVPKSESQWFELDLNNDGVKVKYEIQTVAYYIPGGVSTYNLQETTEPLEVPELNYNNQYLDKYNDIDEENESGITVFSTSTVQSPSYYANEGGTLIHYLTNNVTKANSYSKVTVGKAPSWMNSGIKYYSYDGIYFYTNWRNIKVNGQGAINQSNPFYNYYQYLPFRSKSNYSANIFDSYTNSNGGAEGKLVNTGQYFYAVQDKYGINGALQYAMGIHESGWGKSSLSINKNNLFGMNATDNNPYGNGTSFPNVESGINYHAERYLSWGYTDPIDDARYYGSHVGNKGSGMNVKYASDPFWGEKIAGWYYRFDSTGGSKDYNYYTIGIKEFNSVYNVRSQSTINSKALYQTRNKKSNVKISNYPFLITGEQSSFYQIKSDTPINNQGNVQYSAQYQWMNTYAYVDKSAITYINHSSYKDPLFVQEFNATTKNSLDYMGWHQGSLVIKGWALFDGINLPDSNSNLKTLILTGDNGIVKEYPLTNVLMSHVTESEWSNPENLYNYDYSGYEVSIPVSSLPTTTGNYQFSLRLQTGSLEKIIPLNKLDNLPTKYYGDYTYEFANVNNQVHLKVNKLETKNAVDRIKIQDEKLVIEGWALVAGKNMANSTSVTKTFILQNDSGESFEFPVQNVESKGVTNSDWANPGKIYNYDYAGYKVSIDLSQLSKLNGNYKLLMKLKTNDVIAYVHLDTNSELPDLFIGKTKTYEFTKELNQLQLKISNRQFTQLNNIDSLKLENNVLTIEGWALIEGVDLPTNKSIKKTLVLTNQKGKRYTYPLENQPNKGVTNSSWANPGNYYNYDYAGYKGSISIDQLPLLSGTYTFSILLEIDKQSKEVPISVPSTLPTTYISNELIYEFTKSNNELLLTIKAKITSFTDVEQGKWYTEHIQDFVNEGFILGYSDGTFRPNNSITRAEFVKITNLAFGLTDKVTALPFNDLDTSWKQEELKIALAAGYITPSTQFRPNEPITRQEAAKIVGFLLGDHIETDLNMTFVDEDKIAVWAKEYVAGLVNLGVLSKNEKFRPHDAITRAEAVKILNIARTLD